MNPTIYNRRAYLIRKHSHPHHYDPYNLLPHYRTRNVVSTDHFYIEMSA